MVVAELNDEDLEGIADELDSDLVRFREFLAWVHENESDGN